MRNPLREPMIRVIRRYRAARLVFLLAVWPYVYVSDRVHRVYPRARIGDGLRWVAAAGKPTTGPGKDIP